MPPRVHRLSNLFGDVEAEHLKWMREAIIDGHELLKSPRPDTLRAAKHKSHFPES
jgi:hypothetical protein